MQNDPEITYKHTDTVTSLLCWDQYLLSCSLYEIIKVWACWKWQLESYIYPQTITSMSCIHISHIFVMTTITLSFNKKSFFFLLLSETKWACSLWNEWRRGQNRSCFALNKTEQTAFVIHQRKWNLILESL